MQMTLKIQLKELLLNIVSVSKINETNTNSNIFYIAKTSEVNVRDIILDLDVNKAALRNGIPTKIT